MLFRLKNKWKIRIKNLKTDEKFGALYDTCYIWHNFQNVIFPVTNIHLRWLCS